MSFLRVGSNRKGKVGEFERGRNGIWRISNERFHELKAFSSIWLTDPTAWPLSRRILVDVKVSTPSWVGLFDTTRINNTVIMSC